MKKLIFALLASIVLYSCTGIFGSGVPMEETRGISHMYEGICVESAIRVYLSDEITPNTIHIRADEMILPFVDIYVDEDGILVIRYTRPMLKLSSVPTEVTVPYHFALSHFKASGASRIDAYCPVMFAQADFEASGASVLSFSGVAMDTRVVLSGASRFEDYEFATVALDCELSGASHMEITCTGTMAVQASGASRVNYKGNCLISHIETSGGSEVNKKD